MFIGIVNQIVFDPVTKQKILTGLHNSTIED